MRALLITTAVLTIAGPAAAEPPKAPGAPLQSQPHSRVVLASAENVPAPPTQEVQRAPEPAKRVRPRVTTCRCGDPQVDAVTQEQ